jgi:DNA-binding winged helix-turn-helix (wHTH) protein
MRVGGIELDPASCRAHLNGKLLSLTPTEFRILKLFMEQPGVIFSREQLLQAVWRTNTRATPRTVDVNILRLRRKIEPNPNAPLIIRSAPGFGYGLEHHARNERITGSTPPEKPSTKRELYRLVDELSDDDIYAAKTFLEYLVRDRPTRK